MKKLFLIISFIATISNPQFCEAANNNPSLIITTINGENFDLSKKKGKVILINFWAKWCHNCLKKMSFLDEINNEFKNQNFEIIGLNVERKKHKNEIAKITQKISYPNAIFDEATETNLEEPNSLPTIYIIDKEGKINQILKKDNFSKAEITKIINSLL